MKSSRPCPAGWFSFFLAAGQAGSFFLFFFAADPFLFLFPWGSQSDRDAEAG